MSGRSALSPEPGGSSTRQGRDLRPVWLVPVALMVVAGTLRLVSLAARSPWDKDQGHDLEMLLAFVRDGTVPLLGPPTSIGDFHHGAVYYYLLAPFAWLSDADPVAATLAFALAGIAAVAVTWWIAREIGGPVAGLVAGAAMALSATEVETSTFIWNPNLIPLSSSIALAGAWWAWSSRRPLGWVVAAAGAMVTVQCHVLGVVLVPPIAALFIADVVRRHGPDRTALRGPAIVGVLVLAAGYLPLAINELVAGGGEIEALLAYVRGSGGSGVDLLTRVVVVPIRIVSWPLVGLFIDAVALAVVATAVVVSLLLWRARAGRTSERAAMLWLGGTLAWSWAALVFVAPSLGTVVRELPVDHYHAYLDPVVATVLGVGVAALLRARIPGRVAAVAIVAPLLAWNVATQPPLVHPDGGWPAGEAAGDRIVAGADGAPIAFVAIPDFKGPQAYRFPVERVRAEIVPDADALPDGGLLVVLCDDLFREAVGAPCGGPAEAREIEALGRPAVLADRFEPSPGRLLSLYRVGGSTP